MLPITQTGLSEVHMACVRSELQPLYLKELATFAPRFHTIYLVLLDYDWPAANFVSLFNISESCYDLQLYNETNFLKIVGSDNDKKTLALIHEVKSTDFVDFNKKEKFKLLANISQNLSQCISTGE